MAKAAKPGRKQQSKAARNERRKALATTFNAISVAILVAAFLQPIALGRAPVATPMGAALIVFIVFQAALHYVLGRIED
jgi:hypothetical protein